MNYHLLPQCGIDTTRSKFFPIQLGTRIKYQVLSQKTLQNENEHYIYFGPTSPF